MWNIVLINTNNEKQWNEKTEKQIVDLSKSNEESRLYIVQPNVMLQMKSSNRVAAEQLNVDT
jgi:hypothetical protein